MKNLILSLIFVLIPFAVFADGHADKTDTDYLILGIGYMDTNLDLEDEPGYSGWTSDDDSGAIRVGYGYYFSDVFSLEAHYQAIQGSEISDPNNNKADYNIYTLSVEGVYEAQITDTVDILPRLGLSYLYQELTTTFNSTQYTISEDDYYITYGLGIQFIDSWRFEYYKIGEWDNPTLYLISYKFTF